MNIYSFRTTYPTKSLTLLALISLFLSAFPAGVIPAFAEDTEETNEDPIVEVQRVAKPDIYVCHANESNEQANNPFNKVKLDQGQGHGGHGDDIIPVSDGLPNGQNLTTVYPEAGGQTGQQILDNDCDTPKIPETGTLRVCKILLDTEGAITTGSELDANFSIKVTGPEGFEEDVEFNTTLSLTDDLVIDNDKEYDAQCVTFFEVNTGKYTYEAEEIGAAGEWAEPRYHDYYSKNPENLSEFVELTVDGSDNDNDDADGVVNLEKDDVRTITIVNQIERLPLPPVCKNGDNLLDNASFEEPIADKKKAFGGFWEIFSSVADWTISSDGLELWNGLFGGASHGEQNAELDGTQSTTISQVISTVPGATYELKFDFSPRPGRDLTDNNVEARVNGIAKLTASGDGTALSSNDWKTYSTTFVATGTATEVSFADMGTSNSYGSLIDNTAVCFVSDPVTEEPEICSFDGSVTYVTSEAKKNNGQPVDADRRLTTALDSVAPYINFFGKEKNDWQVNPLDFFTLGIEGELIFEFDGKVAIDQSGDDIAIWEITGGPAAQQTDEKVKVYVSQNGVDFVFVETLTGDGSIDINGTGLDYVKFVKLVDDSAGIQGPNGDGYDVDAITIIDGSCSEYATIVAHKIVCTDEADLPNFGNGKKVPNMTANTAADWVATHESCRLEPNWSFEWTQNQSSDPGDTLTGVAGAPWTTFGVTDGSGMVSTIVTADQLKSQNKLWFREVLKDNYIPFTHEADKTNSNDVSAEFYCHNDVLNYDNREFINKVKAGNTYHCVAWNVPVPPAQCELDIFSSEATLVEESNEYAVATYKHKNWTADIGGATWIWATDKVENPESDETYTFVETFTVTNPTVGKLVVAHDNWVKITINNIVLIDRTVNGFQDAQKYQADILANLVSGENRIEFEVKNIGSSGSTYKKNPAGVLFHIEIEGDPESCDRTTMVEPETETITACKYVGDQLYTLGWGMTFTNDTEEGSIATTTDETGCVSVEVDPEDGPWRVYEEDRKGWSYNYHEAFGGGAYEEQGGPTCEFFGQLKPAFFRSILSVFDDSEEDSSDYRCDFYNSEDWVPTYRIDGYKWNDINGDGVQDDGETLLANWEITISNGVDEPLSTTTDENGYYYFDVPAGEWTVAEVQQPGWTQTGTEYNNDPSESLTCTFVVGDYYSEQEYARYSESSNQCDFGNQEEIIDEPDDDNDRNNSSATRVRRPAGQVLGASTQCVIIEDYMQVAWQNNPIEVLKLQIFLNIYLGLDRQLTGVFNSTNAEDVKTFQEMFRSEVIDPWFERGIVPHNRPTGFVYKTTRWKINDILCPGTEPYPSFEGENLSSNVVIN